MASTRPFSYPEVGVTRDDGPRPGLLPDGYRYFREETVVGTGPDDFRAAAEALFDWRMHRAVGVRITTTAHRAAPGTELTVGLGPIKAPCRVIWTEGGDWDGDGGAGGDSVRTGGARADEEPAGWVRAGWAYGTLSGHPECGEEAFLVTLAPNGQVTLTIWAFSRPAAWYAGLVPPLTRALQRAYARRCGRSLRAVLASRP